LDVKVKKERKKTGKKTKNTEKKGKEEGMN
jgi:hypothetical protein